MAFNTITAKHDTGEYHETSLPGGEGLYIFGARWYDPKLGRFLSADTIVPDASDPQTLNRYAYVLGNPLRYRDPSGHRVCEDAYDCTGRGSGAGGGGGGQSGHSGKQGGSLVTGKPPGSSSPSTWQRQYGVDVRPPRRIGPVQSSQSSLRLPPAPPGFAWVPVWGPYGSTYIKITPYVTVLEADREEYSGPLVSIPGLEQITPLIPKGMLDDLWEEGSLKLEDGRYIQRDWENSGIQGQDVYMFVTPPPSASKGSVHAYKTAAAHPGLLQYHFPSDVFIVKLGLLVTVNDTGGDLGSSGPLDVYVGEGLAAERAFGVHYSEVYRLARQ